MSNQTLFVGLTGQSGAGKSTVAAYFSKFEDCAVIDADYVAREAVKKGSTCLKMLAQKFGYDIIEKDGSLNRRLLAERAFSTPENTAALNDITHPWIIERTKILAEMHKQNDKRIIIFDAPQLFESGGDALCQRIIAVTAAEEVRMARLLARDGLTAEELKARMKSQHDESFFRERADEIIDGAGTREQTERQTAMIYEKFKTALAQKR